MSELLDYDKNIVATLHHIEGILERFALQNFAASGGVFVAYYTNKISLGMATLSVVGIGVVFTLAIWSNIVRYTLFWKLHRIARDTWMEGQPALRITIRGDVDCERYITAKTFAWVTFLQAIIINLLPAIVAIVFFVGFAIKW